jgi:uncharacterized membrane protein YphA (DoxX/SURF4 family)
MDKLNKPGRLFFAIAVAALGVQQLAYADFVAGPLIAPAWLPWRAFWALLSGLILVAAGVGIVTNKHARRASTLLSVLLLVIVLLFHLPGPAAILHDGTARTRAFEALAMCGAAFYLAGSPTITLGRILFGLPMAVFAVQHFMYATFINDIDTRLDPRPSTLDLLHRSGLHHGVHKHRHWHESPSVRFSPGAHVSPLVRASSRAQSRRGVAQRERVEQCACRPSLVRRRLGLGGNTGEGDLTRP